MKEINRQLWGCGYGIVARWLSGSSTSINLQRSYRGNAAGGDGFGSTFGAKYVKVNGNNSAVPVVLTTSGGAITATTVDATNIAVSAVTEVPLSGYDTVTCTDASVTEAAGTYYVRPAVAPDLTTASTVFRYEMMGLRGIVSDSDVDTIALFDGTNTAGIGTAVDSLQSLAVGTYSWWKAIVDTHSAGRYGGQRELT